ncbi:PKD-like family lipoprotein [Pedobacter gandavensis]|uniref:PKD-like family lipoprotein n=1 Tax=Pedobacter gandavensis TaxID=2679963 RepID=UPI0029310980|nr:PKD-like family lipoprotein [Pedobacter gandavensis]
MKKNIKLFLTSILITLLMMGCYKDKGNYEYQDPNVVNIAVDLDQVDRNVFITADSIDLNQNDSLKVKLKLSQTIGTASGFDYQWMVTQAEASIGNPGQFVIGNTEELKTKITLGPNLYRLVVQLKDKKTGVSLYKHFAMNVSAAPWGNEGWLILQEEAASNASDLSVITTRDGAQKGKVYHNVYSAFNQHKLPKGTYKVNVVNYATPMRIQKVSFFYPNGGLEVRSTDFADSAKAENWYVAKPGIINFQLNSAAGVAAGGWEYLINNHQISYRQVSAVSIKLPPLYFNPPFFGSFSLSPFVINSSNSDGYFTLYDQANHCFLMLRADNGTFVPSLPDVPNKHFANYTGTAANLHPTTGSGFDLNNMKHNLIYAENVEPLSTSNGYWNTFFRNNNSDSTYLVQFPRGIAYLNNFKTGRYFLKESSCPGINTASLFACPTYLPLPGGAFYYVNKNSVYTCKVNTLSGSSAAPGLTFPAGTLIKVMKIFKSGYVPASFPSTEGKVLVIATDESASGGGHKVYFFNLNSTGDIIGSAANPADLYTGFEKITDVAFKKALGR